MNLTKYVACICEGGAERAIIDILLESNLLIFSNDDLIDNKVIRKRSARYFEDNYLRMEYDDKVSVVRILDSKNEAFSLRTAYKDKVKVINVVTAPEIEILIILSEGRYDDFKKSRKKPSNYCKEDMDIGYTKSYDYTYKYFNDANKLLKAINEYSRITRKSTDYFNLKDIIK